MPDVVRNYYDAQWWIFLHMAPLSYVAMVLCGIVAMLYGRFYDEDKMQDSGLTVINLRKDDDDGSQ